jgi:hypothetical protein
VAQGVLEAVRISLAGYPTRRTYAEFVDRFGVLVPELMLGRYLIYALCSWFGLSCLLHNVHYWQHRFVNNNTTHFVLMGLAILIRTTKTLFIVDM